MKRRPAAIAVLAALATLVASAAGAAPHPGKVIFACTTASGKRAVFTDTGTGVSYSYGRPGAAPDKAFTAPKADAGKTTSHCCVGKTSNDDQVSVRYQGLDYGASYRAWRSPTSHEANIIVYDPKPGKMLTLTKCRSNIVHNTEDADLTEMELAWAGRD